MVNECGIIFDSGNGCQPQDQTGCQLQHGHDGPHEFSEPSGKVWQWETDWACNCEHCQECEGDYCSIYWPKKACSE